MLVGQRMSQEVIRATPQMTHRAAVELMGKHRIRRLPIVDGDRLVGIVVEKDLLAAQPSPATTLSIFEIYALLDKLTLGQIMKHPVYTVGPDCPVEDAARIMITHKIGCLPVVRLNQLIGIITETDIFRLLVEVLGGGEQGVHFTVRLTDQPGTLANLCSAVAKAGGNIVSITSYRPNESGRMDISVKQQGADQRQLRQYVGEAQAEIVDIQSEQAYQPQLYG